MPSGAARQLFGGAVKKMDKKPQRTAQRAAIINYLNSGKPHPTVKDIYEHVSKKLTNISLTTIYNTLEMLKKQGLITELPDTTQSRGRRFSSDLSIHDHLICDYCGSVADVGSGIDHSLLAEAKFDDFHVKTVCVNYFGICPECKRKKGAELADGTEDYEIKTSVKDGIAEIAVSGVLKRIYYNKMQKELDEIVRKVNVNNILLDARSLDGRYGIAETYLRVRNYPPHVLEKRFALVDIAENADYASFHENTARNIGMDMKWFTDIEKARAWLKADT